MCGAVVHDHGCRMCGAVRGPAAADTWLDQLARGAGPTRWARVLETIT
jgi:hypothetical protein